MSTGEARSNADETRNIDEAAVAAERIREKRDNNPYRFEHDKVEDKDSTGSPFRLNATCKNERTDRGKKAKIRRTSEKTADERENPNRSSYRRRGEEHDRRIT